LVDPLCPGDYNPSPLAETLRLILSKPDYELILGHVRAEWPNEACGLLAGEGGKVQRVYLVENSLHSPRAYQMDPVEQVRVMLEIEAAGWELSGIFHSHPSGPAFPSATDVAQAYYPDSVYLILAADAQGEWHSRAFQIEADQVSEVAVQVVEAF
jgi:[CysO sulfur-carrier protein]-S-L-cysteine hydrolase